MYTPVGSKTMKSLKTNLSMINDIEDKLKILELAAKTSLFYCNQIQ